MYTHTVNLILNVYYVCVYSFLYSFFIDNNILLICSNDCKVFTNQFKEFNQDIKNRKIIVLKKHYKIINNCAKKKLFFNLAYLNFIFLVIYLK
jgi:hypothetical protein